MRVSVLAKSILASLVAASAAHNIAPITIMVARPRRILLLLLRTIQRMHETITFNDGTSMIPWGARYRHFKELCVAPTTCTGASRILFSDRGLLRLGNKSSGLPLTGRVPLRACRR